MWFIPRQHFSFRVPEAPDVVASRLAEHLGKVDWYSAAMLGQEGPATQFNRVSFDGRVNLTTFRLYLARTGLDSYRPVATGTIAGESGSTVVQGVTSPEPAIVAFVLLVLVISTGYELITGSALKALIPLLMMATFHAGMVAFSFRPSSPRLIGLIRAIAQGSLP